MNNSRTYEVENIDLAQEFFHSHKWTDRLPIVPLTPESVDARLDWAGMSSDQFIGIGGSKTMSK